MAVIRLKPAFKDYIWGGNKLKEEYGKDWEKSPMAESWELSCHKDGPSVVATGSDAGLTFPAYIEKHGKQILGSACEQFEDFPILIKFIDAYQNLSIQVHPGNEYALAHEGQYGKTETWYIVEAAEGAGIYYGVEQEMTPSEFAERIKDNTILSALHFQPVKKGEMYFIQSGTIHAIGEGVLIAEIQQNSNVTYRVYDFGRVGADGKPRPLHIEKAMDVTNLVPMKERPSFGEHLADCEYFTVDSFDAGKDTVISVKETSFVSLLILEGSGEVIDADGRIVAAGKGDSLFAEAGSGELRISGSLKGLLTYVRGEFTLR